VASFAGVRGTGNWGTDERPKNFREMILWRRPNGSAPLTALLGKLGSQKVNDPEFAWWEEELNAVRVLINNASGFLTSDVTITVDGGDALDLAAGDVLLVEKALTTAYDHELVVVSSVTSATVIVIKRAQAGTTAAAMANDVALTKIGNVFAEGSASPEAANRNPTKLNNYCQIFKTAYEITETAKLTYARTGDPLANDKKRKMFDHSVALEMSFLFGKRSEDTSGTHPKRYTGGLLYMLSQYASTRIKAYTTSPTENSFLDEVYPIWDYETDAGNQRIAFCGNNFLNNLNKLARDSSSSRVNFNGYVETYGMRLQEWILPQGTIYFRTHPLFNTHALFNSDAFIIDPSALKYRYMRDTKQQNGIQLPDEDQLKGQWLTECGLEMQHAKTMKWISKFEI